MTIASSKDPFLNNLQAILEFQENKKAFIKSYQGALYSRSGWLPQRALAAYQGTALDKTVPIIHQTCQQMIEKTAALCESASDATSVIHAMRTFYKAVEVGQKIGQIHKVYAERYAGKAKPGLQELSEARKEFDKRLQKLASGAESLRQKYDRANPLYCQVPLADRIPEVDPSKMERFDRELKGWFSSLCCRKFQGLTDPLRMNHQQVQAYVQKLKEEKRELEASLYEKIFKEVQIITYEQFKKALVGCVQELNQRLQNESYAIGYAELKSNKWVAEQALPFMSHAPKSKFTIFAESAVETSAQSGIDPSVERYVFFDDVSYSGTQIADNVLQGLIALIPDGKRIEIYVVIPFISSVAKERMINKVQEEVRKGKLIDFHIITSAIGVKTVAEVFPPGPEEDSLSRGMAYFGRSLCAALPEWKVPDPVSVPAFLVERTLEGERYCFFRGGHPPYKPPKVPL